MDAYTLAEMDVPAGKRLISLAQNESALPASPKTSTAAAEALSDAHLYPDPDWTDLRNAIADVHDLEKEQILCGAGSMELIGALIAGHAGPGDTVLSSQFGYAFFRTATVMAGAEYRTAPERRFTVSVDEILNAMDATTRVVCVANPGNPTGTYIPASEVKRLRAGLPDNVLLLIDEAYGEFADEEDEGVFDLVGRGDTVITRTFSKAYAMAGMRVGWGVFPGGVAGAVRKLLNPNNVSGPSQAAATAATREQSYMKALCEETASRRDRFAGRLSDLGLEVPSSLANFVLIGFGSAERAADADKALRSGGVVMRGMAAYGLSDCLRATIAGKDDMGVAAEILQSWIAKERTL